MKSRAKTKHKMSKIGRFDLKIKNAVDSLASNSQCIETSKKSRAKTKHKTNRITRFD